MPPKERAKELIIKYTEFISSIIFIEGQAVELDPMLTIKECALIAVRSHYIKSNSPFPTIESHQANDLYWQAVEYEVLKYKKPVPVFDIKDFTGEND